MQLNRLQYNLLQSFSIDTSVSLDALSSNENLAVMQQTLYREFGYKEFKTATFTKEFFSAFILQLNGTVAVSLGESYAIIEGAKLAQQWGKEIVWIGIEKEGTLQKIGDKQIDYIFVSTIIDTFVKIDLTQIKQQTDAVIISNKTFDNDFAGVDIALFDCYKLSGYGNGALILFSDEIESDYLAAKDLITATLALKGKKSQFFAPLQIKQQFLALMQERLGDDLFLFINPNLTLEYSLHIGLRGIKARELIKTLAFDDIYLSNGEGCSLGLSRPSSTLAYMGYEESQCRWALSLDFSSGIEKHTIEKKVNMICKRYKQIKILQQN
ncbi:MAG: cysteine desulfurase [Campylobacterota bacterium]